MIIKNISNKTIEFFKKNGKRMVCLVATGFILSTPSKAKLEEYDDNLTSENNYVEEIGDEKLTFLVTTEWKKTENYSDGNGPAKENREYQRTLRRIRITENFNDDFFRGDYRRMLKVIEDDNYDNIFEIIEEMDEVIVVDKSDENKLDKVNWTLEVEGRDIKEKMINPELSFNIKNKACMILVLSIPIVVTWLTYRPKKKKLVKKFTK